MRIAAAVLSLFVLLCAGARIAAADGIVGRVVSAPIFANGTVRDIRSGINIYLQRGDAPDLDFHDPTVIGYGIPPGGRMEVEMVSGFQRDPNIPLAQPSILLTVGTPQQGLPGDVVGYTVSEGQNPNTFVITPNTPAGLDARKLISPAPGAARDAIRARGIKVIHVGLKLAFASRGNQGTVAVRIYDGGGKVQHQGTGTIDFLPSPIPQIFPTNIPHAKRNHNWQRVAPGQSVGGSDGTVPLAFLLFARNEGYGKKGLNGVGVLSTRELKTLDRTLPAALKRFTAGLILQDTNGDTLLDPATDRIIGGVTITAPSGAKGQQVTTPLVRGNLYLSVPTAAFDERAGAKLGGSILLLEFIAGDRKGQYRTTFTLLSDLNDITSPDGSSYAYTVVVE